MAAASDCQAGQLVGLESGQFKSQFQGGQRGRAGARQAPAAYRLLVLEQNQIQVAKPKINAQMQGSHRYILWVVGMELVGWHQLEEVVLGVVYQRLFLVLGHHIHLLTAQPGSPFARPERFGQVRER